MATKSRNTNFFIKAICIILSVVFMTGAFHFVYQLVDTVQYYDISIEDFDSGSLKNKTLADTNYLATYFNEDILTIKAEMKNEPEKIREFIKQNRKKIVDCYMQSYRESKENEGEIYDCICELDYSGITLSLPAYLYDIQINPDDSGKEAEEKANAIVDRYISRKDYTDLFNGYNLGEVRPDLKYYVTDKKEKKTATSFEKGVKKEDTLNNNYAFTVVDGKLTCSPELNGLFTERDYDFITDKNCDIYVYVDESGELHEYLTYINGAEAAKKRNPKMLVLCAGAAFILALAFAVYSFVVCGKKMRDGKVKLAWIDYIPTDIHLIASAAAIGGLITAVVGIIAEGIGNQADPLVQKYMYYGVLALVALIWALFIEFMTSFIRACKSEKHLYKNTLIYFFIKYVIVKPIAFFIRKFKEFVSYNPDNFKKPIKRDAVLYFIVNAVLFVVAVIGAAADFAPLSALMALLLVAFNIASAVYVIRYVIALDKIIYAAKTKTAPMVDYNKLPQSLKILVNSLQYTRQELNEAVNKAVRDEHMRTELITNVSHDLKTPLTSIINYVDLLKTCDIQDETAKEYIDILDEKGSRLKRLIEDLIEASKITSGVITLNPVNLSLSELGAQAVYERQSEFAENGLELVFKGDNGNITAFADGNKTFRVIENLLSNARKYSANGSRVYCDVYETQNYSIFEIKNISAEPLDITPQELKERFVRGDKSRNNEGNGLGLSIADNLCKAQSGHLNLTIDGDLFKAQVMLPKAKQLN